MNVTILGAGAYGLGLAYRFSQNKNKVVVWSKVKEEIDVLKKTKMNEKALPNFKMPSNIMYTTDTKMALQGSDIVVMVVATKYISSTMFITVATSK